MLAELQTFVREPAGIVRFGRHLSGKPTLRQLPLVGCDFERHHGRSESASLEQRPAAALNLISRDDDLQWKPSFCDEDSRLKRNQEKAVTTHHVGIGYERLTPPLNRYSSICGFDLTLQQPQRDEVEDEKQHSAEDAKQEVSRVAVESVGHEERITHHHNGSVNVVSFSSSLDHTGHRDFSVPQIEMPLNKAVSTRDATDHRRLSRCLVR
jgi:hypothetical protein